MLISEVFELLVIIISGLIGFVLGRYIFNHIALPILIKRTTKEIEKNPNWITPKLREKYYGFSDRFSRILQGYQFPRSGFYGKGILL